MTARGVDTNDFGPNGWAGEDPAEYDEAHYSAAMIQEAIENVSKPDRLSAYERRVALREVKDILKQLYHDTQTVPPSLQIDAFMKQDESKDTVTQLMVLREEMLRLMSHSDVLAKEIVYLCRKLAATWAARKYSPSDLLEVKIQHAPGSILPCPLSLNVLQSMLDAWGDEVADDDEDDDDETQTATSSHPKSDIALLLESCHVGKALASQVLDGLRHGGGGEGGRQLQHRESVLAARVRGSLQAFDELQRRVLTIERVPVPPRGLGDRTAAGLATQESWLTSAKDVLEGIKEWELLSGIPFASPICKDPFLRLLEYRNQASQQERRGDDAIETVEDVEKKKKVAVLLKNDDLMCRPFGDLLSETIQCVEQSAHLARPGVIGAL